MGSRRTNEKRKGPAYASSISPNSFGVTFLEGNVDDDNFDSILDMPLSSASWEDIHQSVAQGVPETIRSPRVYSKGHNSFQIPQINPGSNAVDTNFQEVSLLPDWNMGWGEQCMNRGNNVISSGGISTFGGDSSFESFNRPQVNRDVTGSSLFCSRDIALVNTRNNVNFNSNQSGLQGKFEGSFLSLGLGGISETVSSSQLKSREVSDKLKETASNELNIACARKATGQTFVDGFMGSSSTNNSGFTNQFSHVSRRTPTNNEFGPHGSLNSGLHSSPHHILQMQQNGRQLGRADKLIDAPSTELKMVHARKARSQTLDSDFMGFQGNNSGFSNQFSNVDQMTSTNYEVGVHSMLNSGPASSRQSILQMQQKDSRNIRSNDMDHYKGKQSAHSATLGGNSAHLFTSQQLNLKPSKFVKPSWMTSNHTPSEQLQYFHSTTANSPNYASKQGQFISQKATPNQVLGGNLFSQRTTTPQVSWVGSGPAGIDGQFPKRLGLEFSVRNSPQSSQGHLSPVETSLQTTNTGRNDGAPDSYPANFQEPFFTYGQSQNALIQLPKSPQGAPSTNASRVDSPFQKLDFHVRPRHKRTAVAPQAASQWVQCQRIIHPTAHHVMPKPHMPVTTALIHPSIPVRSRTQHMGPIAAHIPPVIPYVSNVKPRVTVASAPAVSHITWKDPDATSKLSGYRCFLCKRDLALTSEGPVFQPTAPPPVAVLPCGHTFHDQCLQNITPDDQAKDPPCIPCAIGEK